MGRTPDRFAGPREDEEVQFEDRTADGPPTIEGAQRYYQGGFQGKDTRGVFNYRDSFVRRTLPYDLTIPTDTTLLSHDMKIPNGITLTIADGGELKLL